MVFSLIISSLHLSDSLVQTRRNAAFCMYTSHFFWKQRCVFVWSQSIASLWTLWKTPISNKTQKLASAYSPGCCLTPIRSIIHQKYPITAAGNVFYNIQSIHSEQKQINIKVQSHSCHHSISFWVIRHEHMFSTTVTHPKRFYIFCNSDSKKKTNPHPDWSYWE